MILKKAKIVLGTLISLFLFTANYVDFDQLEISFDHFLREEPVDTERRIENLEELPEYNGTDVVIEVNGNIPFFSDSDLDLSKGYWQTFSDLDSLNRVGVADALLHKDFMPTESRGDISNVYPSGWNQKKLENNVWLYNRSHLIGYQMTGENDNWKNLFTGTQQLNQIYMVQFENEVANYLRNTNNHVRYRVTPIFRGRELVPRMIQMESQSVEDTEISFNIIIFNVQSGFNIKYSTGKATEVSG